MDKVQELLSRHDSPAVPDMFFFPRPEGLTVNEYFKYVGKRRIINNRRPQHPSPPCG